jgi:hypothetical protein
VLFAPPGVASANLTPDPRKPGVTFAEFKALIGLDTTPTRRA